EWQDTTGTKQPLVMWPAPWALTLLKPVSALSPAVGHAVWQLLLFGVLVFAADRSWLIMGGAAEKRWIAWSLAFAFAPSYFVLITGQFGPILLLGYVGFLYFIRTGREALAGACLVLAAIKPQLTLLFWLALLFWAIQGRRWRLIAGGLVGVAAMLAIP